ncbi:MAG: BACON domain-containing protein, partial [Planctomycetes bacterium]|nr:BACON domain-containing protein [Planctomycetota bacterium]
RTNNYSFGDQGFPSSETIYYKIAAINNANQAGPPVVVGVNTGGSGVDPELQLSRIQFNFAATTSGATTPGQSFYINNTGSGTLNWSLTKNKQWISCSPQTGTNAGSVQVTVNASGLQPGQYTGYITVNAPGASGSPQSVEIKLKILGAGQNKGPFGSFETPEHDSWVRSSVPFTGWVLDDVGVDRVELYRQYQNYLVKIDDAVLIEGARSDIEQSYPSYPNNHKAGWGYMMLTNFLPWGDGQYKIHAIATDVELNRVTLGVITIHVDNNNAVKPFGAIDAPGQGMAATGSKYINWGWALTPQSNTIPTDGSTITVWVDGFPLGNPVYNNYRSDIATLFPGYNNSNGAVGYFPLDTTSYSNGIHTIAWSVTDNGGNTDGIGSRYFTVENTKN